MTQPHRLLRILEAFAEHHDSLTPEQLMALLDASRASIYRDLQQLVQAGLVERIEGRTYTLGPRIVELDRRIRQADPLLHASHDLLPELARHTGGTVLLCRWHLDRVLCIQQATPPEAASASSYERGRAMPLYRGATSRAILVNLPVRRLQELLRRDRAALVEAGLPTEIDALARHLSRERDAGHVISRGEVDPGVVGLAVALRQGERLLGSLSVVLPEATLTGLLEKAALVELQRCARRIEGRLETPRGSPASHAACAPIPHEPPCNPS